MREWAPGRRGTFVAVVGPSGAGKDSVIRYARERLAVSDRFVFVRRTITRRADPASEDHDSMEAEAFRAAAAGGAFALWWQAHDLFYGIPAEVETAIAEGRVVIANLSRQAIPDAAGRFPDVVVAQVTAQPHILLARVTARGRETDPEAVARRIGRDVAVEACGCRTVEIDNSGPLPIAGTRFHRLLEDLVA